MSVGAGRDQMEKLVSAGLLAIFISLMIWLAVSSPIYTWDAVPYVGATLSIEINDPITLHQSTYRLLQESLEPEQYRGLISGEYAADIFENPHHFNSQLNMYLVKPLYVASLRFLHVMGLNPVDGLILLSLVPGVLICILLYVWLNSMVTPIQSSILMICFAVAARLPDLSRVPVPDNLSSLAILSAFYFLVVRKSHLLMAVLLLLSVLIRTNNIITVCLVFPVICWGHYIRSGSWSSRVLLCCLGYWATALVLYFVLSMEFDQQWWRLFYHTLIESQIDITAFEQPFSFLMYVEVLSTAFSQLVASGSLLFSVLPVFLLIFLLAIKRSWRDVCSSFITPKSELTLSQLAVLSLFLFLVFFLLFPLVSGWDRFFTPYYAVIFLYAVQVAQTGAAETIQS